MRILMTVIGLLLITASSLEFARTIGTMDPSRKFGAWATLIILVIAGLGAIYYGAKGSFGKKNKNENKDKDK